MLVGSQVSLKYDLDLSLTQVPENLIFYSDEEMTKAFLKENGAIHLDGTFLANDDNKTANRTIYWQWPIETGLTQTEIDNNDGLDSNWIGSDVILGIAATGKQIMGDPDEKYTVTLDLNGGTLANHGEATMLTKQVTYGEAYGDLPVPTREGYRFVGWNGKNLFDYEEILSKNSSTVTKQELNGIQTISWINNQDTYSQRFLQGNFKENTQYTLTGKLASSKVNRLVITICYTDGSSELINYQGRYPNKETFIDINRTSAINKTIDYISGTYSDRERMYIDIDSFQIEEGTEATAYESYYITSSTPVSQNKNHTLTAIWEPISNP